MIQIFKSRLTFDGQYFPRIRAVGKRRTDWEVGPVFRMVIFRSLGVHLIHGFRSHIVENFDVTKAGIHARRVVRMGRKEIVLIDAGLRDAVLHHGEIIIGIV